MIEHCALYLELAVCFVSFPMRLVAPISGCSFLYDPPMLATRLILNIYVFVPWLLIYDDF